MEYSPVRVLGTWEEGNERYGWFPATHRLEKINRKVPPLGNLFPGSSV
jgi:hypothetical protein